MNSQLTLIDSPDIPQDPRDCWRTPPDVWRALVRDFGPFGFDLFASDTNALLPAFFTRDDDALGQRWSELDGPLFGNPPFSRLDEVCEKAAEESKQGSWITLLIPDTRSQRSWWHDFVIGHAAEKWDIRGRVQYIPPVGVDASSCAFNTSVLRYRPGHSGATSLHSWRPWG